MGELATSVNVTVWATMSLLVQTTVPPVLTVTDAASNAKLMMLTFSWAAAEAVAPAEAEGATSGLVAEDGAMFIGWAAVVTGPAPAEYLVDAPLGEHAAIPSPVATANAARREAV